MWRIETPSKWIFIEGEEKDYIFNFDLVRYIKREKGVTTVHFSDSSEKIYFSEGGFKEILKVLKGEHEEK